MRTLVIIPTYNEEGNIQNTVENLRQNYPQYDYIVVNDGSTDSTASICYQNDYKMLDFPINLGLAGAVQAGMKYAYKNNYDAAIQFDSDGQHLPEYIGPLLEKLEEGYDIVIGSRFVTKKKPATLRMFGSRLISFVIKLVTKKKLTDPTSGMRIYNRRMIREFATQINHAPEPDTISYLICNGAKVCEVQVEMKERVCGESYLNFTRSMSYMIRMAFSILLVQWFREKENFSESENED